jgi:flavin reductase (DIM6/NTAB) family NADH-FMN oxidoreductase RutF
MKKLSIIIVSIAALIFTGCNNNMNKESVQQENVTITKLSREEIQSRSFSDLFKAINIKDVKEDVFTLVNKDFTVLTAGNPQHYNSMVASWGGWGILFDKPVTWCFLRSNRYTLELIRNEHTYTMVYFDDEYKSDVMLFGTKSGKDTDKMKESKLTPVQTPDGNVVYKEAKLIIECKLFEITTVSPNDFQSEDARKFVVDAHAETNDYHKIVFGEITNVWVRK